MENGSIKQQIEKDIPLWEAEIQKESLAINELLKSIKQGKETIKQRNERIYTLNGAVQGSRRVLELFINAEKAVSDAVPNTGTPADGAPKKVKSA